MVMKRPWVIVLLFFVAVLFIILLLEIIYNHSSLKTKNVTFVNDTGKDLYLLDVLPGSLTHESHITESWLIKSGDSKKDQDSDACLVMLDSLLGFQGSLLLKPSFFENYFFTKMSEQPVIYLSERRPCCEKKNGNVTCSIDGQTIPVSVNGW